MADITRRLVFLIVVTALPVVIFGGIYLTPGVLPATSMWVAFGGLFYGLAIVAMTAYNIWLTEKANERAIALQIELGNMEKADRDLSRKREAFREFLDLRKSILEKLKQKLTTDDLVDLITRIRAFSLSTEALFKNKEIDALLDRTLIAFGELERTGTQNVVVLVNENRRNVKDLERFLKANYSSLQKYDIGQQLVDSINDDIELVIEQLRLETSS